MRGAAGGFTMIELIMTMIVVGILATFAVGRLDFVGAFAERGVRDKVKAALQFARKAAVAQRRSVCVANAGNTVAFTFDTRAPETGAAFCDGTASAALPLPAADRDCPVGTTNAVCGGSVAIGGTAALVFDPQGRYVAAAAAAISVSGQPAITVEATSGYVH